MPTLRAVLLERPRRLVRLLHDGLGQAGRVVLDEHRAAQHREAEGRGGAGLGDDGRVVGRGDVADPAAARGQRRQQEQREDGGGDPARDDSQRAATRPSPARRPAASPGARGRRRSQPDGNASGRHRPLTSRRDAALVDPAAESAEPGRGAGGSRRERDAARCARRPRSPGPAGGAAARAAPAGRPCSSASAGLAFLRQVAMAVSREVSTLGDCGRAGGGDRRGRRTPGRAEGVADVDVVPRTTCSSRRPPPAGRARRRRTTGDERSERGHGSSSAGDDLAGGVPSIRLL